MMLDRLSKILALAVYGVLFTCGFVVLWTPFFVKAMLLRVMNILWWDVVKFRRHVVLANLCAVFPREREESMDAYRRRIEAIGKRSIWHACYGFFEVLEGFAWNHNTVRRRVRYHNFERFESLVAQEKGFFVLTAHLGTWDLAGLSLVARGVKLAAITRFLRSRFWDFIWMRSRRRTGIRFLAESYSGRSLVRSFREGYCIAFMMDQHTGKPHGIETTFLGLKAWSPKGLAILSRALRAPIVEGYVLRDERGGYDLHVGDEIPPCAESNGVHKDEDVALHVRLCNEKMEQWIRRYPEQYLWLHRRFKASLDYRAALPWESAL
ncbi:MAG TPA: lysophospholipid acyltransferase family protein [Bdellovibrionota bacterium]|jgi:KDO2-lipid IV(A) lauroyltransferase|nr:lysophospholipid acyltransferase family protein [Bdellovibrionota bacterium]